MVVEQTEAEIKQAAEEINKQAAQQPITQTSPHPVWMESLMGQKDKLKKKIDKPEKNEDQVLAELSTSDAWKYLKKFILTRQALFRELLKSSVAGNSYNMEEVGFRYILSAQVEDVLNEIINRVENFGELIKRPEEPKGDEESHETGPAPTNEDQSTD